MPNALEQIDQYIEQHLDSSVAELSRLCAQPSISAQGVGVKECADLVAELLRQRGFTAEVHPTRGHPIVTAEAKGKSNKTLLFYNHYDVQPPEPLDLWESPPFTPTVRDGKLYARGVSDDKGHIVCRLAAIDALAIGPVALIGAPVALEGVVVPIVARAAVRHSGSREARCA